MTDRRLIDCAPSPPAAADLVVIGGGILGAATAFYAARRGLRVIVLEKRAWLCTLTTPAATGAFRAQFDNAEETRLVQESIAAFTHFGDHLGLRGADIGLTQPGYLWVTTTQEGAARQRALLEPRRVTMAFAAAAAARGALFCLETPATGFRLAGDRVVGVETPRGAVSCGLAVVAAGPFSGVVASWAGLGLDVALRIRQTLVMPRVPEVPPDAPMTIDEDSGAHWRPALQGAYLLYTDPTTPAGPPLWDVPSSTDFYVELMRPESPRAVARVAPFWRHVWERNDDVALLMAGQYVYTPDHRPLLGPTAVPGLGLNTGYSGHGVMGSAGGSRLAVDALLGEVAPADNPFRVDRPMEARAFDVI